MWLIVTKGINSHCYYYNEIIHKGNGFPKILTDPNNFF